ncbi:MAG: 50S ribosomal protein L11 methyltransferase [Syntrophomonadaceae bacterium]|jgi:ribosomal protein L11 methyltransferase|nr:50S ribosomal protein L11 methyltransferase [Syntrophomonadaceae bacterium]
MNWREVKILTEGICVDALAGIFHSYNSGGVAVEDMQVARTYTNIAPGDRTYDSPNFSEHNYIIVKAYFPENQNIDDILKDVERVEKTFSVPCKIFLDTVKNEDWEENWKEYYHTFRVGEKLVIKPSWEKYLPRADDLVIEIDPGMAFGTGIHASTRFCLTLMEKYVRGFEQVIDAGCGSGILSIAAVKLGAKNVWGMDVDEVAVRVAKENVRNNGLERFIEVRAGDIVKTVGGKRADIILANITAEVLTILLPEASKALGPGGIFIGSGIVEGRWPGVERQLRECGYDIEEILKDLDWVGVAARKK